jgi:hypothetical protein
LLRCEAFAYTVATTVFRRRVKLGTLRSAVVRGKLLLVFAAFPLVSNGGAAADTIGQAQVDGGATSGIEPGVYTYSELIALGVDPGVPTPESTGLPLCDTVSDSGTPARTVQDDEPVCVVDPETVEFGVGLTPPDGSSGAAGYHWNGYRTTDSDYAGGRVTIEVTNPQVDHTSDFDQEEFVVSRVLSVATTGKWIEVGWSEVSYRSNNREVYTFASSDGLWHWYSYTLDDQSFYSFRTRGCTVGGESSQCAEIYWSGSWQMIDYDTPADCRGGAGNARCAVEEYTEIASEQSGSTHPDLTGNSTNRVDWKDTKLRLDNHNWIQWTRSSTQGTTTAYDTCLISSYYRFYAIKGSC